MRIQMVWYTDRQIKSMNFQEIENGTIRISNGPKITMVYYEGECTGLDEVRNVFALLQTKGLRCRSLKIFEQGKLPRLEQHGFTHNSLFYVNASADIPITAVPYGDNEWCMIIERRTGAGIHMRMLHFIPYFAETYQQLSFESVSTIA
ncbi:TPA: hypothetical protein NJY08_004876 [Salmonella enterica subsp. enterica serovar Typhi str. AG3]|nr:hypothetical protein [Salmonella enterica subsp. enterica serovar Typhi str. AG3]